MSFGQVGYVCQVPHKIVGKHFEPWRGFQPTLYKKSFPQHMRKKSLTVITLNTSWYITCHLLKYSSLETISLSLQYPSGYRPIWDESFTTTKMIFALQPILLPDKGHTQRTAHHWPGVQRPSVGPLVESRGKARWGFRRPSPWKEAPGFWLSVNSEFGTLLTFQYQTLGRV